MKKQILSFIITFALLIGISGCGTDTPIEIKNTAPPVSETTEDISPPDLEVSLYPRYAGMAASEITAKLTLKEKVAQMLQPHESVANTEMIKENGYGSILGGWGKGAPEWKTFILGLQEAVLDSSGGIPFIYGNDAVHGVNNCAGAVIFPHNIGIGAANDTMLTYQMGLAVADEAKLGGILWTFSPCVASAQDPRWGRTYESYSSDIKLVTELSTTFARGMMDGGILPCAKHFFADGDAEYGKGEGTMLIDRGDAILDEERIQELLSVYKALIDVGVKTVMISHSAVNGVKMHENTHFITDILKGELGFDGFIVSDWESIHNISNDPLKEQVITSVNAGIDMLMEPFEYEDCMRYIIEAVNEGSISQERIDDAVTRIIDVKIQMGLFNDPMMETLQTKQSQTNSDEYRDLARQLVEKSLVLLKNENQVLPLKNGSTIFLTGPALDNTGVLCGGWTHGWPGNMNVAKTNEKTILDGFLEIADAQGFTIITDPAQANEADMTILCIGEMPYSEWEGDTEDLSITGQLALPENNEAIQLAKTLGKPTVTCIVSGRNVIIDAYEYDWDAVVLCWLPGSEGNGIANVLAGKAPFTGKLPMPYYSSVQDIGTDKVKYELGYGLEY